MINVYLVDVSTASVTINLPPAQTFKGRTIEFKDNGSASAVNKIILDPNGTDEIDGVNANKDITSPYDALSLYSDGSNWFII